MEAISILEYDFPEGLNDIVVDIFHMVMEVAPLFFLHALPQFKPKLLLEILAAFFPNHWIPVSAQPVCLGPNPKVPNADILCTPTSPLIFGKSLAFSFQASNGAIYLFSSGPIRVRSLYLIF